jgi:signal transduction histidine kinase
MGLGLSIAKKIVDAHNGQLLAENLLDEDSGEIRGTLFTLIIPRDLRTVEMQRQIWMEQRENG